MNDQDTMQLRSIVEAHELIDRRVDELFAEEDDALRAARATTRLRHMPAISISPAQGRHLQILARAVGARKALEIGALAGYSAIWLARALPEDGRLISLEISEKHATAARESLTRAGLADRAEVRLGPASETLPALTVEAPFDLIFIDADKANYPLYLEWALRLTRPGAFIVADNTVRRGLPLVDCLDDSASADTRGLWEYNRRVARDSRLLSLAMPTDEGGLDGFTVSLTLDTRP